jgi:hypothetical protein
MDKMVATKFGIEFIDNDLRDSLPNVEDANEATLALTHLPDEFPPDKAAALATDHENKDKVPVLALLPVAVPLRFDKPAPSGSLADEETQTMLQNIANPFKAWADSVLHTVTHAMPDDPFNKSTVSPLLTSPITSPARLHTKLA